jgi:hypothetical protein
MLILDKKKAVERVVALTSPDAEADPEEDAASARSRTAQRVARFEPAAAAAAPGAPAASPSPARKRRRRARAAVGPAPA